MELPCTKIGTPVENRHTIRQSRRVVGMTGVVVACSPKVDPDVMRVSTAREGKETQDDSET